MRRAITFGYQLGLERPFLHQVAETAINHMGEAYPELRDRSAFIHEVIHGEEERFYRTLARGIKLLDDELASLKDKKSKKELAGGVAFKLYDTYGFPFDLTELISADHQVQVDEVGFKEEMEKQREQGRKNSKIAAGAAVSELWHHLHQEHGETVFTGYDRTDDVARVVALVKQTTEQQGDEQVVQSEQVERLEAGERGIVLLDRTPFYAESGGQVGDAGNLGAFVVEDTPKVNHLHLHTGEARDAVSVGDVVEAQVDVARRDHTRRNHTGTHLLHAALRTVLGEHVTQKGSLVGPHRLRFDFSHPKPLTAEEISEIERLVNREILANTALETSLQQLDQAIENGAMALFGEKYDDEVRVVAIPGFSVELCGGTHCGRTGDIGLLRVVSETGVAAGVPPSRSTDGHGRPEGHR